MNNNTKLLIQVEAIVSALKDAKHVQSLPTELYGMDKLKMISDVRERFNVLTVSLDWDSLNKILVDSIVKGKAA